MHARHLSVGIVLAALALVAACGRSGGADDGRTVSAAPPAATVSQGRTYTTNFPLAENPISEGGRWANGGRVGLDWTNVSTTPGRATGLQCCASYTDATALLTGLWGPDQQVTATVFAENPRDECYQEVELRLRSALSVHRSTGYEISFKSSRTSAAYLIIVRWNGPLGDFNYLFNTKSPLYGVKTGDVVSARVQGNRITAFKNGVQLAQVADDTFTVGNPGMGFNLETRAAGCGRTNGDYGYTSFTATDSL